MWAAGWTDTLHPVTHRLTHLPMLVSWHLQAKEEREKAARLSQMRRELEQAYGAPAPPPSQAEVAAALKEIVASDISPGRLGSGGTTAAETLTMAAESFTAVAAAEGRALPASARLAVAFERARDMIAALDSYDDT